MVFVLSVPPALSEPVPGCGEQVVRLMNRARAVDYPALLGRVCRRWFTIADASQGLHAYMYVDVDDYREFRFETEYYDTFLARSGSRPLTLSVDGLQESCMTLFAAAPFAAHVHRLRRVSINTYMHEFFDDIDFEDTVGCDLFPLFPGMDTPLLEIVHVNLGEDGGYEADEGAREYFESLRSAVGNDNADASRKILQYAPRLSSFSLERFNPGRLSARILQRAGLNLRSLTCLGLSYVSLLALDWYKILRELPALRAFAGSVYDREEDFDDERQIEEWEKPDAEFPDEQSDSEDEGKDAQWHARRDAARAERARKRAALRGPHTLPHLAELSLTSASEYYMAVYDADDELGLNEFLRGLILPSLASFSLTTHGFMSKITEKAKDEDWITVGELVVPALEGLVRRSGCEIRELALNVCFMSLADLVDVLKVLPGLRALHFDMNMHAVSEEDVLARLARRSPDGKPELVPLLTRLKLDNQEVDYMHKGAAFHLQDVLRFVRERWPVGWTTWEIATMEAVILEEVEEEEQDPDDSENEEDSENAEECALDEQTWEELHIVRSRSDIDFIVKVF
ncbi:hypothetical protein HDZ31DRAFT_84212 [Schizophyllum fasciatum]